MSRLLQSHLQQGIGLDSLVEVWGDAHWYKLCFAHLLLRTLPMVQMFKHLSFDSFLKKRLKGIKVLGLAN